MWRICAGKAVELEIRSGLLRGLRRAKTGAVVVLPMHSDFADWLLSAAGLSAGLARLMFFPRLAGNAHGRSQGLEPPIRVIMKKAGITRAHRGG